MVEDAAFAGEVPVGVVREVDHCGFVGGGGVVELELVIIVERVGDTGGERAGITFLAVGADVGEADGGG